MKVNQFITMLFLGVLASGLYGQEAELEEEEGKHRITIMPSHTYVKVNDGDSQSWATLASFGLNYDYWIKENMAIGLHSDFIAESFIVTRFDKEESLERNKPLSLIGVFLYKLENGLTPLVGLGVELDEKEQFALLHLGLEYGVEFAKGWEFGANATFDVKIEVYDSFAFGLSLSKRL
ncbi:MAG: hypothetical protein ACJAQ4_001732 [Cryomorphaceae bacterium]|jgi:hypothetical protein